MTTTTNTLSEIAQNHPDEKTFIAAWITEGYEGNFDRHELTDGVTCYLDTDNGCVIYIYNNAGSAEPSISSDGRDVDYAAKLVTNADEMAN